MHILVTGGAGFIGSHIVDYLIENNHSVWIVDKTSSLNLDYTNSKAVYKNIDISSDKLEEIFRENHFDVCIHLAAQSSVAGSVKDPLNDAVVNIIGTINVVQLCKKYNCKKIIAASTAAVYGNPKYIPIDENHSTDVLSPYGLSKLTMEKYVQLSGVPYVICRFSNVYGKRQHSLGETGVVSIFSEAMMNNKDIYIDGDGEQSRDFIYVKDIARIIYQLLNNNVKDEIFNVSTNTSYTINELFRIMAKAYSYKKEPLYRVSRAGDIKISQLDNRYLIQKIKSSKFISLEDGINRLKS